MRILLIEDDNFFQKFYGTKLSERGFKITSALNGVEGLKKAREEKPDFILLDIIMPKMDGFEVLEELSSDPLLKKIPVLVFSTLGQEQDMLRALKLGAAGYVNKSFFDLDKLLATIKATTIK